MSAPASARAAPVPKAASARGSRRRRITSTFAGSALSRQPVQESARSRLCCCRQAQCDGSDGRQPSAEQEADYSRTRWASGSMRQPAVAGQCNLECTERIPCRDTGRGHVEESSPQCGWWPVDLIDDAEGFRANVGIIVCDARGLVLIGGQGRPELLAVSPGWHPIGESPSRRCSASSSEEIGLDLRDVDVLGCTRDWLRYRLPEQFIGEMPSRCASARSSAGICCG